MKHHEDDISLRLGRWFLVGCWILSFAFLAWFFHIIIQAETQPEVSIETSSSETIKSLTVSATRAGHYVLPGKINGSDVVFLVDTGATLVAVPEAMAKKLKLDRGFAHDAHTAGGTVTSYATKIDSLELGPIQLKNVKATIAPKMPGKAILLGMNVLQQLEFTQRNNKLILKQHVRNN